jgi:predicted lipoprotein with Yx(FWY)xxD motif/cytochrome c5
MKLRFSLGTCVLTTGIALIVSAVAATTGQVEVRLGNHADFGPFLVTEEGMSLYLLLADEATLSTCYDACAEAWPPLTTREGAIVAAEGLDPELLGTVRRDDGDLQVTYSGWPLYTWIQDDAPGDVTGQGFSDVWYLVSPAGNPVGHGGDADDASEGNDDLLTALVAEGQRVFTGGGTPPCAACHGAAGEGGVAPRLASGSRVVANAGRFIRVVLQGGHQMPGFGHQLSDRQVAAVVTYVRNTWDNDYGLVTEEEVKQER